MNVNRWHLKQAVNAIHAGGIVAYPTEAVYGLGCDPLNAAAVLRLLKLKRRTPEKGLILIAADLAQLQPFLAPIPAVTLRKLEACWPGPVTWLLPARPETPWWLRGRHTSLAVRITAHPPAAALCRCAGHALVSTSANVSGHPPARAPLRVRAIFGDNLAYLLRGNTGGMKKPTEIHDAASARIVRPA